MIPIFTVDWRGKWIALGLTTAMFLAPLSGAGQAANPYRGLWVGQVTLTHANEVSVPLDKNNIPIAPDPKVPTPAHDPATMRLILHVSGAGQVGLLKDVAILNRNGPTNLVNSESDIALVTDETLYGAFPPQPAQRIASAVFDFGDSKATEAVDAMVDAVVNAVTNSVQTNTANLGLLSGRVAAQNAATLTGKLAANPIITNADVALSFDSFLQSTNFNALAVDRIASSNATTASSARNVALTAATNLLNKSFFRDSRGIDVVFAVSNAVRTAANGPAKTNAAQNTAASFADAAKLYDRFISGKQFGDMIAAASDAAGRAAASNSATFATISNFVNSNVVVNDTREEAIQIQVTLYRDTRGSNAVEQVVNTIVTNAFSFLGSTNRVKAVIQASAEKAGREMLASGVRRYPVASQPPTESYSDFVRSDLYRTNAETAARAAAEAAVLERRSNPLYTLASLKQEGRLAAIIAMENVYAAAARVVRNELPLAGAFGPGLGDPRLTWVVSQTNVVVNLGAPALTGTIYLPASHPTNPFRHRRHPDHTVGFDVTRNLRLDFDAGPAGPLPRAGYGVDRIKGTYREEIFGLHKPLGPQQDVGLRVEGSFELNRVSLIDTLNAR